MWYNHYTNHHRRRLWQVAALLALITALIIALVFASDAHATLGTTKTINFQGRLLTAAGAVVPDGNYNIEFKIYEGGSGAAAGNPDGTLKWTEDYVNGGTSGGVEVRNGFLSVNLGSVTPFGTSVDWSADTLWLSMDVAGSDASCTTFGTTPCVADGEMLPMNRLTATPYAINAGAVGGKTADNFVQLAQGVQTDASTNTSSIYINKTGTGNLIQLQNAGTDIFTVANNGDLTLGSADHTISLSTAAASTAGGQLSVAAGAGGTGSGGVGGTLNLQGGAAGSTDSNGGNIVLAGGSGNGTGSDGLVVMSTPTYKTVTDDANCHTAGANVAASCTITSSSVNSASAVVIGFSAAGQTATLPNPANATAGRAMYILGADGSSDFKLSINGGVGTNLINLRAGAAASLIWNGTAWTVAGITNTSSLKDVYNSGNNNTNIQIGNGSGTGEPTLLTLDHATSAPATSDASMLGSMYYDTTKGTIQCYEASGWGDCSAKPDVFVTLSPVYAGAVTNGSGIGTLTNDFCSGTLGINDGSSSQPTVCGSTETYNFYDWTSTEATAQTKSIYVTYQLSSNFTNFVAGSTSLMGRTDAAGANVSYQIYRNNGSGLTACGSAISVSTGAQTAWQKATASGTADPSTCGFAAGDSIVIKITTTASGGANAYISNLGFTYSSN